MRTLLTLEPQNVPLLVTLTTLRMLSSHLMVNLPSPPPGITLFVCGTLTLELQPSASLDTRKISSVLPSAQITVKLSVDPAIRPLSCGIPSVSASGPLRIKDTASGSRAFVSHPTLPILLLLAQDGMEL